MDFHNIEPMLFISLILSQLFPIILVVLFIGLWRKFSPSTEEVKKLKFFLVFLSSLIIPVLIIVIPLIALAIPFIALSSSEVSIDNVSVFFVFAFVVIFFGGMLGFMAGGIPAILTAFISLLLRLYVFKKSQIPWFISTVLVGFIIPMIQLIFVPNGMLAAISFGVCGAFCSFSSALVLTVFPKRNQAMKRKIMYSLAILLAIILIPPLLLVPGTTTIKNQPPYTTARLPENAIYYIASWEAHDLYCGVKFNDGIVFDNSGFSQGDAQSQFDLMTFIHNGRNRIALDVASWGWWDLKIKGDQFEKRAQITNKDAYCQLSVKSKVWPDGEEKEIAFLKVSVNDDYQLQIDSSMRDYDSQQSPARTVSSQIVNRQGVLDNATHNMVFNAGRDINVSGVPDWEASRFDDISSAIEQIEDAYREFWQELKDNNH